MKIRIFTLLLISSIAFFTSCSDDDTIIDETAILNGTWNLTNSTLSEESIDVNIEEIIVTYTFNTSDNSLIVVNNAIETTDLSPKASGILSNGTYTYEVLENDNKNFLIARNQEIGVNQEIVGSIIFNQEQSFILNQNETPSGAERVQFVLTFEK